MNLFDSTYRSQLDEEFINIEDLNPASRLSGSFSPAADLVNAALSAVAFWNQRLGIF